MSAVVEDYSKQLNIEVRADISKSALVVVDMQYATGHHQGPLAKKMQAEGNTITDWRFQRIKEVVIPNIKSLLKLMRDMGGKVIYLTAGSSTEDCGDIPSHMREFYKEVGNYVGGPAHSIIDELKPIDGEHILRKTSMGAFASTDIEQLLKDINVEHLYFTGVSTNVCVESTAREAADRGYSVTIIDDACSTTHKDLHDACLSTFSKYFGKVRSTVDVTRTFEADKQ
jgi:nicotinamidase-related amidase